MNTNAGIDYGNGMTNIDESTGIRYGVISAHTIGEHWYESSEPVYPDIADVIDVRELREELGADADGMTDAELLEDAEYPDCVESYGSRYTSADYEMGESGDDGFGIFVTRSPFFTFCRFCSPCAPGAGNLDSTADQWGYMLCVENGVKTYAPGHDWFESGTAPYPVYSVETGELVAAS